MTSLQSDIKDISDISRLVNNARESPNFDLEKTLNLINTNDKEGLITSLLTWAKEIFPLYSVPSYTEQNLIPVILEEINKTNLLTKPCICCKNWHPPELPPIYYKCKTKTCGCI
jgi:hypothetical protein